MVFFVYIFYLSEIFSSKQNIFQEFNTDHKVKKFFLDKEKFVSPVPYTIGYEVSNKKIGGTVRVVNKMYTGQYIPLRSTIQKLFQLPGVFNEILNYTENLKKDNGIISNFMQGEIWQNVQKNFENKIVLPIFLYYDEFEVNNVLSSHSNVQNIGGVYGIFPCFPPWLRSKLENIVLIALFNAHDKDNFGNEKAFAPILEDLKILEEKGLDIVVGKEKKRIYVSLGLVLGDNLGLNGVLGFVKSFSSNHFCRVCKAKKEDVKFQYREDVSKIRDEINYKIDVEKDNCSETGIKESCIFNKLKFFHVTKNVSIDLMHDVFEGICRYELSAIILHLVDIKKYFTLQELNFRIQFFDYSFQESQNKNLGIKAETLKNHNLGLTASEMMTFVEIFSLLIGDKVPQDDPVWILFLKLRKIIDLLNSSQFDLRDLEILKNEIFDHHQLYVKLFNDHLKPKFHFLIHYASLIPKIGPPINVWSMRGEAKHREFKKIANATTSRSNIALTLSVRHQLKFSQRIIYNEGLKSRFEVGPRVSCPFPNMMVNFGVDMNVSDNFFFHECVKINGIVYKKNMFLIESFNEKKIPTFSEISLIVVCNSNISFVVQPYETVCFANHFYAYEISLKADLSIYERYHSISYPKLAHVFPCALHVLPNGKKMISLRTTIDWTLPDK